LQERRGRHPPHCCRRLDVLYFKYSTGRAGRTTPTGEAMFNILANILGAVGAITFVGYFAYKVNEPPLTIIVTLCLALMVYSFYDDIRIDRAKARARAENGGAR
jgi:hypothetical protein